MLSFSIIVALIISILAVVFALQNAGVILVNFLIWGFEGSLSLFLLLAFIMGVIVSLLVLLPRIINKGLIASDQNKKIKELRIKLEEEVNKEKDFKQSPV